MLTDIYVMNFFMFFINMVMHGYIVFIKDGKKITLFEFLFCLPIFLLLLGKIYEICESDIVSVEMKIEDIVVLTSNFILAIILIYRLSNKRE